MAARDDFFIRFGSNAAPFAKDLARDLEPADRQIRSLNRALVNLEKQGNSAIARVNNALAADVAGGKKKTTAGVDPGHSETTQIMRDLQRVGGEVDNLVDSLKIAVAHMRQAAGAADEVSKKIRRQAGHVEREQPYRGEVGGRNQILGSTGGTYFKQGGIGPRISNEQHAAAMLAKGDTSVYRPRTAEAAERKIAAAAERMDRAAGKQAKAADTQEKATRIKDVTKAQITDASFDRVVKAINRVEAAVRKSSLGGGAKQNLSKLLENVNLVVEPGTAKKAKQATERKAKADTENAQTTEQLTRAQKKQANRAAADAERKDIGILTKSERERRERIQSALDLPQMGKKEFLSQVGGRGGLTKKDLLGISDAYLSQGYSTGATKKMNVEEIAQRILNTFKEYDRAGRKTREDLRTGGTVIADTRIDKSVKKLLGPLADLAGSSELQDARKRLQEAGAIRPRANLGYTAARQGTEDLAILDPQYAALQAKKASLIQRAKDQRDFAKDPEATPNEKARFRDNAKKLREQAEGVQKEIERMLPHLEAAKAGFRGGNAQLSSRMKGQEFPLRPAAEAERLRRDQQREREFEEAGFALAAKRAKKYGSGFDPYSAEYSKMIEGPSSDPAVAKTRSALGALRRGTTELDELARQFHAGVQAAKQRARQLGLEKLFASPEFNQGLERREASRLALEERALSGKESYERFAAVREGAGQAIAGRRLAAGTKDTMVSPIPGMTFNKFTGASFASGTIDPKVAKEVNRANTSYAAATVAAGTARENLAEAERLLGTLQEQGAKKSVIRQVKAEVAARQDLVERAQLKQENKAQHLLSTVYGATQFAPPLASLIGRDPQKQSNIEVDRQRQEAIRQRAAETAPGPTVKSAEILASQARRIVENEKKLKRFGDLQEDVNASTGRLGTAQRRAAKTAAAAETAQADAIANMTKAQRRALEKAKADYTQAGPRFVRSNASLAEETRALARFGEERTQRGAFKSPYKRDIMGYDASLGYGAPAAYVGLDRENRKVQQADARRADASARITEILKDAGAKERAAADKAAKALADLANERQKLADTIRGQKTRIADDALRSATTRRVMAIQRVDEAEHAPDAGTAEGKKRIAQAKGSLRKASQDLKRLTALTTEEIVKEFIDAATAGAKKGVADAKTKGKREARGTKPAEATATAQTTQVDRAQIQAARDLLRAKRDQLQADRDLVTATPVGELTRGQKGARTRKLNAIRAGIAEIDAQVQELDDIVNGKKKGKGGGTGGGGGRGTGGTGGTAAAGGGRDDNVLKQILAAVREVNKTLNGGIKVTGSLQGVGQVGQSGEPITRSGIRRTASEAERTAGKKANDDYAAALRRVTEEEKKNGKATQEASRLLAAADQRRKEAAKPQDARTERYGGPGETQYKEAYAEHARRVALTNQEALAQQNLDRTMQHLSATTRGHIDQLRQMSRAGKDTHAVARQMETVYTSMARDLGAKGAGVGDIQSAGRAVLGNATGTPATQGLVQQLSRNARSANAFQAVDQGFASGVTPGGIFGEQSLFTQAMFGNSGFWSRIMASTGTFIVRNFAAGFVFGMTAALGQVIQEALAAETTFVRVSHALQAVGQETGSLRSDLSGIATQYGVSLNETYQTAAGLVGLFDTPLELADATRVVTQMQVISGGALTAAESMGVLASVTAGFGEEAGDLAHINDVLTVVQNNLGVNLEVTAEGVARLSGLAASMKISFEETAVFSAQIAKLTNQTGAAAGEQFSRILAAMQTGRGRAAITKNYATVGGEETGIAGMLQAGEYGEAVKTMIANWDNLSGAQQRNVAVTVAGQRQMASFLALMSTSAKTLGTLEKAETESGAAAERMEKIMRTLNSQIKQLGSNLQVLAENLIRTGILDAIGVVLLAANKFLSAMNSVFGKLNDFADNNPLVGFARDSIFALIGLVAIMKLVGAGMRGMRETLRAVQLQGGVTGALMGGAAAGGPRASTGILFPSADRPARASYGEGAQRTGVGSPIMRNLGFVLDRSIGVPAEAAGKKMQTWGDRLSASTRAVTGEMTARQRFTNTLRGTAGTFLSREGRDVQGTRGFFQGPAGARGMASSLGDTANLQGQLAAHRQSQLMFASAGAALVPGDAGAAARMAALQAEADQLDRVAKESNRASGRMGALSRGMSSMASSGALLDVALVGVGLAIAGLMARASEQKELRKIRMAAYGKDGNKVTEEDKEEAYYGPAEKAWMDLTEPYREGSAWEAGTKGIKDFTYGAIKGGIGRPHDPGAWLKGGWNQTLGDAGIDTQTMQRQGLKEAEEIYKSSMAQLEELMSSPASTIELVDSVQSGITDKLEAERERINSSDDMTEAQKVSALGLLEQAEKKITEQVASTRGVIQGISQVNQLLSDQVKEIDTLVAAGTAARGMPTVEGVDLSPYMQQLVENTGVGESADIRATLDRFAEGGLNTVEQAKANQVFLKAEVENLQNEYLTKLASDPDAAVQVQAQLQQKIAELAQSGDRIIDAAFTLSDTMANVALFKGNYKQAIAAQERALKAIRRARRQVIADERRAYLNAVTVADNALNAAALPGGSPLDILNAGIKGKEKPPDPKKFVNKERRGLLDGRQQAKWQEMLDTLVRQRVRAIEIQIAQAEPSLRASLEREMARITGKAIEDFEGKHGKGSVSAETKHQYRLDQIAADQAAADQARANAEEAKAAAEAEAQKIQAQREAARATALARVPPGAAVAVARMQLANARAAQADAAKFGTASVEYQSATQQVIAAQWAIVSAQGDVAQAHHNLRRAYAEARGDTVGAARAGLAAARAALAYARRMSGGAKSAEVLNAKAAVITARASARDAVLQDRLDTIDFNLQMGKITQSSAIAAMRQILRTANLTKQQRRDLLLRIKGMKDEIADSQWNFGDIKLPTPYQMRRYIKERRLANEARLNQAVGAATPARVQASSPFGGLSGTGGTTHNETHQTTIQIDGADVAMVKKIIRETVGSGGIVRTSQARRRG